MLELFDIGPKDRLIAHLLLSNGLIGAGELRELLGHTKQSLFFSLGEYLLGNGVITLERLEELLADYCRKSRLGELALAGGLISEEQLELALSLQQSSGQRRIGEIFVELHLATEDQIEMLLDFQRRCRIESAAC